MQYVICEQRPKHYSIQLAPLPNQLGKGGFASIDFPTPKELPEGFDLSANMLTALQDVGLASALTTDNLEVIDCINGDYLIEYKEAKHHHSQQWLRLVILDELGKRIYHREC